MWVPDRRQQKYALAKTPLLLPAIKVALGQEHEQDPTLQPFIPYKHLKTIHLLIFTGYVNQLALAVHF